MLTTYTQISEFFSFYYCQRPTLVCSIRCLFLTSRFVP